MIMAMKKMMMIVVVMVTIGGSKDNYSYSEDIQISDILVTTKSGRTGHGVDDT